MTDDPRDQPTRVGREPAGPGVPARPVLARPVRADQDWTARDDDSLRTLQGLLALVSVLALTALGVAIWALVDDGGEPAGQAASRDRVVALSDRVEQLESRADQPTDSSTEGRASQADVDALESDVATLKSQVAEAGDEGGGKSDDATAADAATALSTRVDELAAQVDGLRSQQGLDSTGTTP